MSVTIFSSVLFVVNLNVILGEECSMRERKIALNTQLRAENVYTPEFIVSPAKKYSSVVYIYVKIKVYDTSEDIIKSEK